MLHITTSTSTWNIIHLFQTLAFSSFISFFISTKQHQSCDTKSLQGIQIQFPFKQKCIRASFVSNGLLEVDNFNAGCSNSNFTVKRTLSMFDKVVDGRLSFFDGGDNDATTPKLWNGWFDVTIDSSQMKPSVLIHRYNRRVRKFEFEVIIPYCGWTSSSRHLPAVSIIDENISSSPTNLPTATPSIIPIQPNPTNKKISAISSSYTIPSQPPSIDKIMMYNPPPPLEQECINVQPDDHCDFWKSRNFCNEHYVSFMKEHCYKSCTSCGHVGMKCKSNNDCSSNLCDARTKTCYKSEECVAIKHESNVEYHENHVKLVFVGSNFDNLKDLRKEVDRIYSVFDDYAFFDNTVQQYSAFFVNKMHEESFCQFNCNGIDRLLCCDRIKAKNLAKHCFPSLTAEVQTIVVHNSKQFGGSGGYDMATVSTHKDAPLVAVHELGHSLFDLVDEYDFLTASNAMNCESDSTCPKWKDLSSWFPDLCEYKGCEGGNYYISEKNSFMNALNKNVGPVLLRYTCCTYYALTGSTPQYCVQFLYGIGRPLIEYCEDSGYRRRKSYGASYRVSSYNDLNTLPPILPTIETPNSQYVEVLKPHVYILDVTQLNNETSSKPNQIEEFGSKDKTYDEPTLPAGYYHKKKVYGDFTIHDVQNRRLSSHQKQHNHDDKIFAVIIKFKGGQKKRLYFSKFETFVIPPFSNGNMETDDRQQLLKQSSYDDTAGGVQVTRTSIELVIDGAYDNGIIKRIRTKLL